MRKIGILTGGGDCPGLNAVIRGVVEQCKANNIEVYANLARNITVILKINVAR